MKVEMVLMDAGALQVVLTCGNWHKRLTIKLADSEDENLASRPVCGDPWAERERFDVVGRMVESLRDVVQLDASVLSVVVQFAAERAVRDAAGC